MKLRERLNAVTGGAAILPLVLLFVLNLVDELDQVAFGVLAPEIADDFNLSETAFISLATVAAGLVILLIVPVGVLADRRNRVKMTAAAALLWSTMSVMTGLAPVLVLLVIARFGSGLGRVMNEPVHASLLADYYPPHTHGRIFSIHRLANPIGLMLVLVAGLMADTIGWRWTFVLLAVPTVPAILFISRLHEPARGASLDLGLAVEAEEKGERLSMMEAYRRLRAIPTIKRSWWSAAFLGAGVIPIATFFSFFYEEVYNFGPGPWGRAGVLAVFGAGAIGGLQLGSRSSTTSIMGGRIDQLATKGGLTIVFLGATLFGIGVAPWVGLSIAFTFLAGFSSAFQSYNLPLVAAVAPPRLRSQAFGWFGLFFAVGAIVLASVAGNIGETEGYRYGMGSLAIVVAIAGFIYMTAAPFVKRDAEHAYATLQAEADARRQAGQPGTALLSCRGVEVAYDQVQVLFGVDMDVRAGEIVALLGTNGAGKSTHLKAISGLVDPIGGTILFEGRDITHSDAGQTAALGIVQVPGGKAVFPTLTVTEHLRAAGWLYRDDPGYLAQANQEVLDTFPRLRERLDQMAGNLSGGEQQMLALGMAFIAKPKLLMIDELSLGLAPTVVEQLLKIVARIRDNGTAIVLVEQSLNVALSIADRAYFMEKGEVRFEGPTEELVERDDIVRSVFLEGAAAATSDGKKGPAATAAAPAERPAADARAVLTLVDLVKRFGGIRAVDGVSLELREGEILGLIGPNGAGKTTVFDLVSGFLIPDGGRIRLGDDDITEMAPDKRSWLGLGRSFQDARLIPSLTVSENIALGLERHLDLRDHVASTLGLPAVSRVERDVAWTVADLIDLMNLGAFRDKFVRELSTGSRRIVDLAMCIAHDPAVLLLDEPSSGIAQRETEALGPLLKRIQAETGCALLVIEHDMPLITTISDRMIALELGRPIAEGTPAEVTSNPAVVSSYLGGDLAAIGRSGSPPPRRREQPLTAAGRS